MPIIFASAEQAQASVFKGYEYGAVDYLLKPIDPVIVRSKVHVFAELYRKELARNAAEEELRRSNADLDQFASFVAHDLQAPLRRIVNGAAILDEQCGKTLDPESKRWLRMMTENSQRMHMLVEDLLTYSKAGRSKETSTVHLDGLVAEVVGDLAAAIEDSGAKIHYASLPKVVGNALALRQVVQNLLGNAIKYRRKGVPPEVKLTVEKRGTDWWFQFRDNGIGIDPAQIGELFMIFRRLHGAKEYPGTGIGLAICKKIVERQGGKIWVESVPGQGSAFQFTWPEAPENTET